MSASSERKLRATRDVLAGLRPIIDTKLCRCVSDCPVCGVGALDPLGLHRPLVVACWTARPEDPVRLKCWSGCDPEAIRQAIIAPAPDWQAIAEAAIAAAENAVSALEAIFLAASRSEPELAAA